MSSVVCTNPACGKTVALPADAPAGKVYGCPHCKQALPPVPAPIIDAEEVIAPAPRKRRRLADEDESAAPSLPWLFCGILTCLAAVGFLIAWLAAEGPIHRSAVSSTAAAAVVIFYVLARCTDRH